MKVKEMDIDEEITLTPLIDPREEIVVAAQCLAEAMKHPEVFSIKHRARIKLALEYCRIVVREMENGT